MQEPFNIVRYKVFHVLFEARLVRYSGQFLQNSSQIIKGKTTLGNIFIELMCCSLAQCRRQT